MRDDRERIQDILDAIENIEKYSSQGREEFDRNELIQVWILHHIQIIGEAASSISDEMKKKYPEIPWLQIVAMRNILVHEYFRTGIDEVWVAVEKELPDLKAKIEKILVK
jgi:uncharacterized protein with HEPN domain